MRGLLETHKSSGAEWQGGHGLLANNLAGARVAWAPRGQDHVYLRSCRSCMLVQVRDLMAIRRGDSKKVKLSEDATIVNSIANKICQPPSIFAASYAV